MEHQPAAQVIAFPEIRVSSREAFLRGLHCQATRKVYEQAIKSFQGFLNGKAMAKVTRRDVEAYRSHLEALGRAASTVAKHMAALNGFFTYLLDEEELDRNPAASARRPKLPTTSPRKPLSIAEVQALVDACKVESLVGRRDQAMLMCLAVQGWRISEVLALDVEDLGEEGGHKVATVKGKGGKVVRVPLAATTWTAITNWCSEAAITKGPVFIRVSRAGEPLLSEVISQQAAWKRLRLLARRAGITRNVHAHLFRHTAVTEALAAGVALHLVQDFARHADPATTRRYDGHRQSLENPAPHVLASRLLASSVS